MLDVHPPHTATHTWRDFFIHIATITVGLLIAVGLEQTVEALHRHDQVRHAREELAAEREKNMKLFALETRALEHMTPLYLTNQTVLRYLREHPGAPADKWPGTTEWNAFETPFVNATWSSLQRGSVAEHLSRQELEEATELYERLGVVRTAELNERYIAENAGRLYARTAYLEQASPADLDKLIGATDVLLIAHARIGMEMLRLHQRFPAFGPAPAAKPLSDIRGARTVDRETTKFNQEFLAISGNASTSETQGSPADK